MTFQMKAKILMPFFILGTGLLISCGRDQESSSTSHYGSGSAHVHCQGSTSISTSSFGYRSEQVEQCTILHEQVHINDYYAGRLHCGSDGTVVGYTQAVNASECKAYKTSVNCARQALNLLRVGTSTYNDVRNYLVSMNSLMNDYCGGS